MLVSGIIHIQYVSVEEGAVMLVLVAMVQVPDDEVTTVLPLLWYLVLWYRCLKMRLPLCYPLLWYLVLRYRCLMMR